MKKRHRTGEEKEVIEHQPDIWFICRPFEGTCISMLTREKELYNRWRENEGLIPVNAFPAQKPCEDRCRSLVPPDSIKNYIQSFSGRFSGISKKFNRINESTGKINRDQIESFLRHEKLLPSYNKKTGQMEDEDFPIKFDENDDPLLYLWSLLQTSLFEFLLQGKLDALVDKLKWLAYTRDIIEQNWVYEEKYLADFIVLLLRVKPNGFQLAYDFLTWLPNYSQIFQLKDVFILLLDRLSSDEILSLPSFLPLEALRQMFLEKMVDNQNDDECEHKHEEQQEQKQRHPLTSPFSPIDIQDIIKLASLCFGEGDPDNIIISLLLSDFNLDDLNAIGFAFQANPDFTVNDILSILETLTKHPSIPISPSRINALLSPTLMKHTDTKRWPKKMITDVLHSRAAKIMIQKYPLWNTVLNYVKSSAPG